MALQNGRMTLSYSEQPTTSGRDAETGAQYATLPGDFLSRPGAIERYIAERLAWSVSFAMRRTDLTFDVFDETRAQRQRLDGLVLPDEQQFSAGLAASVRVGVRTRGYANARRGERELLLNDERVYASFGVGMSYELGTRTTLALDLQRTEEEPRGGSAADGYDANLLTLRVTRTFQGLR
jgi:uncharacterized protein (PEP-CTERM system associated)